MKAINGAALTATSLLVVATAAAGGFKIKSFNIGPLHVDTNPKHWVPGTENAQKTVAKAGGDVHNTLIKAERDFHNTAVKAGGDTGKTLLKAVGDTADAGKAVGRLANRLILDTSHDVESSAEKTIHGKTLDGLWELGTTPLKSTDEDAGKAVKESPLLNAVGQVAATVYGGPGGAAAYAAWSTLKITGNPQLALRAGVISGATAWAFQGVEKMPSASAEEVARKAVVAGTIAGMAVAAAHGGNGDVKKAALLGAGMIIVQAGYQKYTNQPFDPAHQIATAKGYCMLPPNTDCAPPDHMLVKDAQGNVLYGDPSKMQPGDKVVNYVGVQVDANTTTGVRYWVSERSPVMTTVGHVPPWNTMAIAHDKLVIQYHLSTAASIATIAPAIVLTYAGTGAGIASGIQSAVSASAKTRAVATPAAAAAPSAPPSPSTIICNKPDKPDVFTTITVAAPQETSGLVCEVTLNNEKGVSHPWRAKHEQQYCNNRAHEMAAILMSHGWVCLTQ